MALRPEEKMIKRGEEECAWQAEGRHAPLLHHGGE